MIEVIEFNGKKYPKFQSEGNAARWVMALAQHYCKGSGYDIGYSKEEWKLPGAIGIDEAHTAPFNAMNLPCDGMDYLFSSHCLEHVKENYYNVLDYWLSKLKSGGILFMYLPHKSQEYWLPKNNRKHVHSFDGSEITEYLESLGHTVFCSGVDLNNAFVVVCEKALSDTSVNRKKPFDDYIVEPASIQNFELSNFRRLRDGLKELTIEEYNKYFSTKQKCPVYSIDVESLSLSYKRVSK